MRVGIVTYWSSSDNYGQQLQCFALQKYLRSLGHDAYLIKYMPTDHIPRWRKIARSIKYRLFVSDEQKRKIEKEQQLYDNNKLLNKKRGFEKFREKYLYSTDIVYTNVKELRANPPEADIYVCGSDQVWNNSLGDPDTAGWFLDFGKPNIKRVAYAASIGRELEERELETFTRYLKHFDAISVREQKAYALCHKLGFSKAIVAIDPTLMLKSTDYDIIKNEAANSSVAENPYVFVYILNIRTADEIYWNEFQTRIEKEGFSVRSVASSGYLSARDLLPKVHNEQATIPEWLGLIKYSEYVITTSFHGVVFCLLYHKPFYAVLLHNEYSKGNDRIISLLEKLGLEKRIVSSNDDINSSSSSSNNHIDWLSVDEKIADEREKSIDFLISGMAQDPPFKGDGI